MSTTAHIAALEAASPLLNSSLPEFPVTSEHLAIARHAVAAIQPISRSFQGISDTSTSEQKPALKFVGDELTSRVSTNFVTTVTRWLVCDDLDLSSAAGVKRLVLAVAAELNQGITGEKHGLWRTWSTPFPGQTAWEDIEPAMDGFYGDFAERFCASQRDVRTVAAWNEKRFNAEIHPLADGCGKTSKALSTIILGREGYLFPQHSSRTDYFLNINRPLDRWTEYYCGLIKRFRLPVEDAALTH